MATENNREARKRQAHILVVDDNPVNRKTLARAMENAGHRVSMAENGSQALAILQLSTTQLSTTQLSTTGQEYDSQSAPIDVILLDVLMPEMDGYQVLQLVKANSHWQHIPVIMISAVDEMDSVVRCIELGATDYLHKPFKSALLHARLNSSLAAKRLRDLELEYLEQVGRIVQAAEAVEAASYDPKSLDDVARRPDALGRLAHTFQRMAEEVHLREQRLVQQLRQLQMDVDEMKKALSEPASIYLPIDRIHALVTETPLPERSWGTVLSADISGFTPLTAALTRQLGRQRGAEELTRTLNQVYNALINTIHKYHGSVISFSGDAITCWFDSENNSQPHGLEALTCGLALHKAMQGFSSVPTPSGMIFSLGIKVAAATGSVQRYLVGDPDIQVIEVLAGKTLDNLADTEKHAQRGEVLAHASVLDSIGARIETYQTLHLTEPSCYMIKGIDHPAPERPWPKLPPNALTDERCRYWLLPEVYERLHTTGKQYLAEFRPVAALFLQFTGLDYDNDPQAKEKLDAFITQTQAILRQHHGSLIQLTTGDKGSYLYAVFGVPSAHVDSPLHAIRAALDLQRLPRQLPYIPKLNIGISHGQMRVGAYGGEARRTYGALGEQANLAARLMQHASEGILCEAAITQATQSRITYQALDTILVKGYEEPLAIYRPIGESHHLARRKTALVGKQAEQAFFGKMLQALLKGCGGVLWVTGEPGIGKTRLMEAFEQDARRVGVKHIYNVSEMKELDEITRSLETLQGPALMLIDDAQEQLFEAIQHIIGQPREEKLSTGVAIKPDIAVLFVLANTVSGVSSSHIGKAVDYDTVESGKVNEGETDIAEVPGLIRMALHPLKPAEIRQFSQNLLGVEQLPEALAALIAHTGGLPFFIEKIIDHLLDSEQMYVKDGVCTIPSDSILQQLVLSSSGEGPVNPNIIPTTIPMLPAAILPATVQGMLKSRLENLSADEQMGLRLASALGQEFPRDLFEVLLPTVEQNALVGIVPRAVLGALVNHGLLKCLSDAPSGAETAQLSPTCAFTSGLICTVAYESMLYAQRRALHRQIAEWYETMHAADLSPYYHILADHWRRAEEMGKAIDYLEKAAQQMRLAGDLSTAERLLKATLALSAASAVLSQDFWQHSAPEN